MRSRGLKISDRFPFRFGACALLLAGCSSASSSNVPSYSASAPVDAGLMLNVPTMTCPDAATLVPRDAGTCVVGQPRDFTRDVVPLFDGCAGEVCHNFGAGAIVTEVGVLADECCNEIQVIDPGHPEQSYLLNKLSGRKLCAGWQMPLDRQPLSGEEIQVVADWICEGAPTTH